MLLRSRIAPTPSGYLHLGNALNFILTWLWVRKEGGQLRLRIDDNDTTRAKPEFIDDTFRVLDWLGLDWDEGPQTPDEHNRTYSQALRRDRYVEMIDKLIESEKVFACTCSRKDLLARPCDCYSKNIALSQPETALRIATPTEPITVQDMGGGTLYVPLENEIKDFIIRRRDGVPAYQVASLADDEDYNINLVIRGEDLLNSSAAQLYLASLINTQNFQEAVFYHHPLLYDVHGGKLSKSDGSLSLKTMREQGVTIQQLYARVSRLLGLNETYISLKEMLDSDESFFDFSI